jgi:hypothetical protein
MSVISCSLQSLAIASFSIGSEVCDWSVPRTTSSIALVNAKSVHTLRLSVFGSAAGGQRPGQGTEAVLLRFSIYSLGTNLDSFSLAAISTRRVH